MNRGGGFGANAVITVTTRDREERPAHEPEARAHQAVEPRKPDPFEQAVERILASSCRAMTTDQENDEESEQVGRGGGVQVLLEERARNAVEPESEEDAEMVAANPMATRANPALKPAITGVTDDDDEKKVEKVHNVRPVSAW